MKPLKQHVRRMTSNMIDQVKEEIKRLPQKEFIRTNRYVEWLSIIVLVVKDDGKFMLWIDFGKLNTNFLSKDM